MLLQDKTLKRTSLNFKEATLFILKKIVDFKLIATIFSIMLFVFLFGDSVPVESKEWLYTLSNIVRKLLIFCLPFLVFPYLVVSITGMKSKSTLLIAGIAIFILLSNFTSMCIGYAGSITLIPFLGLESIQSITTSNELLPKFDFALEPIVEIEITMVISVFLGIFLSYYRNEKALRLMDNYMGLSSAIFQKLYIPILPLYVLGTMLKLSHELDITALLSSFGIMILMILMVQLTYIFLMFLVGASYHLPKALRAIKNAFPAGVIAFSTMSSIVTMPFTIKAAEQNIKDPNVARLAIGSTVNCHDVGECISLPMIALTLYFLSFGTFPDLNTYLIFAFFAAAAQFTGVSVPGGSVIILLPFLSKYLGFTPDMLNLIIAISIFTDPIGTSLNVMGNSAFAMVISKIYEKMSNFKFIKSTKGMVPVSSAEG